MTTPGSGADPGAADAIAAEIAAAAGDKPAALVEHHHSDVSGGWLRAAVFGAMDGLVTNIGLIAGVGGGGLPPQAIILTGMAGLVAGAISMALGEYTSVTTSNEQLEAELAKERRELERFPHAEAEELALRWVERGLDEDLARQVAYALRDHPEEALRVHAQEELGVVPESAPSPWTAAISSFVCFSIGGIIPLLSYLFGSDSLWLALAIGGAGLFTAGALTSRFTHRRWWASGLRQLTLGMLAAGATYAIGKLIGVSTAGL